MSEFTVYDFSECLNRINLPAGIKRVVKAWGAPDDGWVGGFVARLKNGQYAYISGWCDYSGWG